MKGVVYNFRPGRWLAAHLLGRHVPSLYDGSLSCLSYCTVSSKPFPGPDWVRLRPILSGLCGSDLATITTHSSPVLSAVTAFPVVMGHELVAEVVEIGSRVDRVAVGDRVVVNPFFGCEARNISPWCRPCAQGFTALCQNADRGALAPGMLMGFCPDEPGGWSDEALCHQSQCYVVSQDVTMEEAVLVEPLAVGLHAALLHLPKPSETALVIGGGMIAFSVLIALSWMNPGAQIVHSFWEPFQATLSQTCGAGFQAIRESPEALVHRVGGRSLRPRFGSPVFVGGHDVVYDCVGSPTSMNTALRTVRAQGTVVLVGAAATLPAVDWTFVWSREIRILGSMAYGPEPLLGAGGQHTFDWTLHFLRKNAVPVGDLITHRFPLTRYRDAITANLQRERSRAIKTVFDLTMS